jgi:eukaryotic-like serine/threonine-protein kinase
LLSQSLPAIRAAISMQNSDPNQAIEFLKIVTPYELGGESLCCLTPVYVRGLAYLQARQGQQAAAEFQKLLQHPGIVTKMVTGSLARLQLARAQVMTGDKAAARKSYQDFLTLWKDADPDIPIYEQAKAEYAKLQ